MANVPYQHLGSALATDYFFVREQFSDEQWDHFLRTRRFVDDEVLPAINEYWERAELPWPLMRRLVDLDLYGEDIAGYGCPGMSPLARGLVNMELHRGDGSLGTFLGVQSGLAMKSIDLLGSEAQKERWLPAMARLETIGAFALTEPAHGSDSVALETSAHREGDTWVLDGAKRWIGNGSIADVVVVFARSDQDGQVKAFLVETETPGFEAVTIGGKGASRAIWQAAITLDGVRVPESSRLPGAETFKDAGRVLVTTRSVCAWGALGHAVAAYDAALTYSKQRTQFGKPLAGFQIVQERRSPACSSTACRSPAWRRKGACRTRSPASPSSTTPARRARSSRSRGTCSAATASCSRTTLSATWATSRSSTPTRAPRPCRR